MASVICVSNYMCTRVHLYQTMTCTNVANKDMHPHVLLPAITIVCYSWIFIICDVNICGDII